MTKEELDNFLVEIGGLENGWRTDMPPITNSHFFGVGPGWYGLIKDLIQDLIELGWDKQTCQVKEKFGGLRFYINKGTDEIYDRITEAERKSYEICEETGLPGELRNDLGWYRTLCDEEYQKIKEKRNGI
jgi:hypothetical protein